MLNIVRKDTKHQVVYYQNYSLPIKVHSFIDYLGAIHLPVLTARERKKKRAFSRQHQALLKAVLTMRPHGVPFEN